VSEAEWSIMDLESTNGTLVDFASLRCRHPRRIDDGAIICVGQQVLVFRTLTERELAAISDELREPFASVPTRCPDLALINQNLRRLAASPYAILLCGATGTGKEVYARAIHRHSGREGGFVAINCAALDSHLLESELFGYEKGAHSQATQAHKGLVEAASRGTLFLDEVAELPESVQARLLRFLQDGQIRPLGASHSKKVDVRVVAATNRPLEAGGAIMGLRDDIRHRLGEIVNLPKLEDRAEDIGVLADDLLQQVPGGSFRVGAGPFLWRRRYPGNVRQLEGILVRAAIRSAAGDISDEDILSVDEEHELASTAPLVVPRRPTRDEMVRALRATSGNVSELARRAGKNRTLLHRIIRRLGIEADAYRDT